MAGGLHPHRRLVLAGAAAALGAPRWARAAPSLAQLEARCGGRLGVHAFNLASGKRLSHRADERFAMCSSFKALLASAVLARVDAGREQLDRLVPITKADMKPHAPVSETYVSAGKVSIGTLAKAAVEVSDNPAANLLLKTIGGPAGLTAWLRRIGDQTTRLDRWELELNSAIKGDPRDTTTPAAMAATMARLTTGQVLTPASRDRLVGWMSASTTGAERLRKHLPPGWRAGDKTGTGANGATGDVAVFWPPKGGPIVAACYITETSADLAVREGVMAEVGRIVAQTLV